jgi:long-chain acyl-CoA synthetase
MKFLTALIVLHEENVIQHAQDNKIPFTTYESLTRAPQIVELVYKEVDTVNKSMCKS